MNISSVRSLLITLLLGFLGAFMATWAGLPAAPLVGACLVVSIASFCKVTTDVPVGLRNIAFAVIGSSLGSGITQEALAQSLHWPISLLALAVAVLMIIILGSWLLSRFFLFSPETAVLATAPGAISYILSYAINGCGDIRAIMVVQNIRLVLVATLLPLVIKQLGFAPGHATASESSSFSATLAVIGITLLLGTLVRRWRIPASFLLAGMLVSGIGHYLDVITGRPPYVLLFLGFTITGTMVGARFGSLTRTDLRRQLFSSLCVAGIACAVAAIFAYTVSALLNIPYGQTFVAFAPGGIEVMAAMAIALGYDPAFVAIHHLFRTVLLFILVPVAIKYIRKHCRQPNGTGNS